MGNFLNYDTHEQFHLNKCLWMDLSSLDYTKKWTERKKGLSWHGS